MLAQLAELGKNTPMLEWPQHLHARQRRMKRLIKVVLALALTGFLLWRAGPSHLAKTLVSASPLLIGAAFLVHALGVSLKAYRFRVVSGRRLSLRRLFRIVVFQDTFNTFVPARAGELSYVVMLRREGVPTGEGVASLALARLGDFIAATIIFYASLAAMHSLPLPVMAAALPAAVMIVTLLGGIIVAALLRDRFPGSLERAMLFVRLPEKARSFCHNRADEFLSGLKLARDRRIALVTLLTSIGIWLLSAVTLYLWLSALGARFSFWQCAFVQATLTILAIIPIYALIGPAATEGSFVGLLMLFGVDKRSAPTYTLAVTVFLALYYAILILIAVLTEGRAAERPTAGSLPSSESPSR